MLPFVGDLKKWLVGTFIGAAAFLALVFKLKRDAAKTERNETKIKGLEHANEVHQAAAEARIDFRTNNPDSSEFLRKRGLLRD